MKKLGLLLIGICLTTGAATALRAANQTQNQDAMLLRFGSTEASTNSNSDHWHKPPVFWGGALNIVPVTEKAFNVLDGLNKRREYNCVVRGTTIHLGSSDVLFAVDVECPGQ